MTDGLVDIEGSNALGEDVFPGPGLGPGLRAVVGSRDGGLFGRPTPGDEVLFGTRVGVCVELLGRGGRNSLGESVVPRPGFGPGLRGVVGSRDGALVGRTSAGDDVLV